MRRISHDTSWEDDESAFGIDSNLVQLGYDVVTCGERSADRRPGTDRQIPNGAA